MINFKYIFILKIILLITGLNINCIQLNGQSSGNHNLTNNDTEPPKTDIYICPHGVNVCRKMMVKDLPLYKTIRSNLKSITLKEGSYNVSLNYDSFEPCISSETYWSLRRIDICKDSYGIVNFCDCAGNDTTYHFFYPGEYIKLSEESINFGKCNIGDTLLKKISIVNESETDEFYLSGIEFRNNYVSGYKDLFRICNINNTSPINLPYHILPLDSFQFLVKFIAKIPGVFENWIQVDNSFYTVKIDVEVVEPFIKVSSIFFDSIDVETISNKEFTICNEGTGDLIISHVTMPTITELKPIFNSTELSDLEITPEKPLIIKQNESRCFQIKFIPEKEKNYCDSIIFHSNSVKINSNNEKCDNVVILNGQGIEPAIFVSDFDWGRKRISREQFPIEPYPATISQTNQKSGLTLYNKSNQTNKLIELIYDSVNYNGIPTFNFNKYKIFGRLFGAFERVTIPATFFPRKLGSDTCVAKFKSFISGKVTSCVLKGFGVVPKIEANDLNISANYNNNANYPAKGLVFIKNLDTNNWEYCDTMYIFDLTEENIGTDLNTWQENHFRYEKSKLDFPIKLNPGEYISIPIEYKAESDKQEFAFLSTKSDALKEIKVKIIGNPNSTNVLEIKKDSIFIYPNPSENLITINNLPNYTNKIQILDELGKIIRNIDVIQPSDRELISIEELSQGKYFLRIFIHSEFKDIGFVVVR